MKADNDNINALDPSRAGEIIGEVATWITDTAIMPLPALSMMTTLATLAGMCGSSMLTPVGGGINTYVLGVQETGGGKAHPPKAGRRLANKVKPGSFNGGDPTSAAAIERVIRETVGHSTCLHMDEFGITLQNINSTKADSTAAGIRKFLLAIYDQADSVFDGRAYARLEPGKKSEPIYGPALSLIATTTPDSLFKGLSESVFSEGFFNRFIIVPPAARLRPEDIRVPGLDRNINPSIEFIDRVSRAIASLPVGNFAGHSNMPQPQKRKAEIFGGEHGEAKQRWNDIFREQTQLPDTIYGRLAENVMKLATLRAISSNPLKPVVQLDDIIWSDNIVRNGCRWLETVSKTKVAETSHHARRNAIMDAVAGKGGSIYFSKLLSAKGVGGSKDKTEVCNDLVWLAEAGRVVIDGGIGDDGRFYGTGATISVPKAA